MTDAMRAALETALGPSFQLGEELRGGMSRVFLATDRTLGRRVVVKTLGDAPLAGLMADRFRREILLAAGLQHPNVVPLLSAGTTEDGTPYYVMPFVEGETLRARLARGAVPPNEVAALVRDVARALGAAHRRGIVHRDIKPENIFISDGVALVGDFGVSKAVDAAYESSATATGTAIGTPAYMAPEQAAGETGVGARADLYALGLVAWELLSGRHPFEGRSAMAMVVANMSEPVPPIRQVVPAVPHELATLVDQLVQKEPARRPTDADAVVTTLTSVITPTAMGVPASRAMRESPADGALTPRRGGRIAMLGITIAALLGVAAFVLTRPQLGGSTGEPEPTYAWSKVRWVVPITAVRITADDSIARAILDEAAVRARFPRVSGDSPAPLSDSAVAVVRRGRILSFEDAGGTSFSSLSLDLPRDEVVDRVTGVLLAIAAPELGTWTLPSGLPPRATDVQTFLSFDRLVRERPGSVGDGFVEIERYARSLAAGSQAWPGGFLLAVTRTANVPVRPRDSIIASLTAVRPSLTRVEQTLLDYSVARDRGDVAASRGALGELVIATGSPEFARLQMGALVRIGSLREAQALAHTVGRGPGREHLAYWAALTRAEHLLGDHAAESVDAVSAISESGTRLGVRMYRIRALAALGQLDSLAAELREASALPPDVYVSAGWALVLIADELAVHGTPEASRRYLADADDWYRARASGASPRDLAERAQVLQRLGRDDEAIAMADAAAAADPLADLQVLRALTRYRAGRRAAGDSLWARVSAEPPDALPLAVRLELNYRRDTGAYPGVGGMAALRRAGILGDTAQASAIRSARGPDIEPFLIMNLIHADPDFISLRSR